MMRPVVALVLTVVATAALADAPARAIEARRVTIGSGETAPSFVFTQVLLGGSVSELNVEVDGGSGDTQRLDLLATDEVFELPLATGEVATFTRTEQGLVIRFGKEHVILPVLDGLFMLGDLESNSENEAAGAPDYDTAKLLMNEGHLPVPLAESTATELLQVLAAASDDAAAQRAIAAMAARTVRDETVVPYLDVRGTHWTSDFSGLEAVRGIEPAVRDRVVTALHAVYHIEIPAP